MPFYLTLFLSVSLTVAFLPLCRWIAVRYRVFDQPGGRKVHEVPVPRCGGIAMAVGAIVPLLVWNRSTDFISSFLAGALILVAVGGMDDFVGLGPAVKFVGQAAAALLVIFWGGVQIRSLGGLLPDGVLLPPWISIPLTLLVIVGVTNAINLSDGLDGLAGGICLLVFFCIGYLAFLSGDTSVAIAAAALGACIFGFLRFNTHPATIFMGDAGSLFLGYSAAVLSLRLTQSEAAFSPLLPLIILGMPILDTLTVIATRVSQGISPFRADKNHFHHTLMAVGLHHPEAVLVIYALQTALVFSALAFRYYADWFLLGGYIAFSTMVLAFFAFARRTGWTLKRTDLFDVPLKGRLRRLRDEGILIKYTFRAFEIAIPLLLLVTCFLPDRVPGSSVKLFALASAAALAASWLARRESFGLVLRAVLFLLIPIAIHFGETAPAPWFMGPWKAVYNACFGIFAVSIAVITKFSRRRSGFKNNPMDFLIVILAVVVPNMPEQAGALIGVVAARIVMLYFSFEVLLTEARGKFHWIVASSIASLAVLATR